MKLLLVPVTGEARIIDTDEAGFDSTYDAFSTLVGGDIQLVGLRDHRTLPGHNLYCNETAKLTGMPRNERATALMDGLLFAGDEINGDAVFVGPIDDEGDDTDFGFGLDVVPNIADLF